MKALSLPSVLALAIAAVAFGALALAGPSSAKAAPVTFEHQCTGAEEVPSVTGPGSALARLTFDDETNVLAFQVTVRGISGGAVTAAHIHGAPAGSNGPVVFPLSLDPFTAVHGSITLTNDEADALLAGDYYINVHSNANPGGFARCQLIVPAAPDMPDISPPSAGDAGLVAGGSVLGPVSAIVIAVLLASGGFGLALLSANRKA